MQLLEICVSLNQHPGYRQNVKCNILQMKPNETNIIYLIESQGDLNDDISENVSLTNPFL